MGLYSANEGSVAIINLDQPSLMYMVFADIGTLDRGLTTREITWKRSAGVLDPLLMLDEKHLHEVVYALSPGP